MRITRAVVGALLVIVSYPMIFAGGGLWLATMHSGGGGAYTAVTQQVHSDGYALVVDDVDAAVPAGVPFASGWQSTLSVAARGPGGPLFLGLAPYSAVQRYLAGAPTTRIDRVRLAQGPLPVDLTPVAGPATPGGIPFDQSFWVATSTGLTRQGRIEDPLTWTPAAVRGEHLALVVMNADASPAVDVRITVALTPRWLVPAIVGLFVLGGVLLLLAVAALAWPSAARDFVYVLDKNGAPEFVRRLWSADGGERASDAAGGVATTADAAMSASGGAGDPSAAASDAAASDAAASDSEVDLVAADADVRDPASDVAVGGPDGVDDGEGASATERTGPARSGRAAGSRAESPTWEVLLATTRPPATPRLMWPPKRVDRPTSPPVPFKSGPQAALPAGRQRPHVDVRPHGDARPYVDIRLRPALEARPRPRPASGPTPMSSSASPSSSASS